MSGEWVGGWVGGVIPRVNCMDKLHMKTLCSIYTSSFHPPTNPPTLLLTGQGGADPGLVLRAKEGEEQALEIEEVGEGSCPRPALVGWLGGWIG